VSRHAPDELRKAARHRPATFESGAWRLLTKVPTAGALPADWQDVYYVGSDGIHALTRHLTQFALLVDTAAPSVPTGFAGTMASGALTLSWTPGKDSGGTKASAILYVNGVEFSRYDPTVKTTEIARRPSAGTSSGTESAAPT
jgi:hypothetical protein